MGKQRGLLWCIYGVVFSMGPAPIWGAPEVERPEWGDVFVGTAGSLVLAKDTTGPIQVWNAKRARTGFLPASTFKIPHSLIALETGVMRDLEQVFPWDGIERFSPPWNQDHTLATALSFSVVPIYQGFAREIGLERM